MIPANPIVFFQKASWILFALSVILGGATIVALLSRRLRQSHVFWILFSGVNISQLLGFLMMYWLGLGLYFYRIGPTLFLIASLFILLWAVRSARRPRYVIVSVALLTLAWLVFLYRGLGVGFARLISDPRFFLTTPIAVLDLLTMIVPIVCCLLLLIQLALYLGQPEPGGILQLQKVDEQRIVHDYPVVTKTTNDRSLAELKARFAKGEIDEEEYAKIKAILEGEQ